MSSDWSDLLTEGVRRGCLARWRRAADGVHLLIETIDGLETLVSIEEAEAGHSLFLFGLRVGMLALGPIDVEVDYRPALRRHRGVTVPYRQVTPRTVVDLQTAAWCVDPTCTLTVTESDEGDVHARMT